MKLVFLDKKTIGEDMDFSRFSELGDVAEYDFTQPEEAPERVKDADILISQGLIPRSLLRKKLFCKVKR